MRTIAVINQKGGCGKTTTAINLGAALGRAGLRTLLVDLDSQGHCAAGLGVPESSIELDSADLLLSTGGRAPDPARLLWRAARNLDLIPSRVRLAGLEAPGSSFGRQEQRERALARGLSLLADRFDVCLVDCAPSIGLLTFNALVAADLVLVPVETAYFAMQGAVRQLGMVRSLGKRLQTEAGCVVLPTMHDPGVAVAEDLLAELGTRFGKLVLPVIIRRDAMLREAASFGRPVCEHAPESDGAKDYAALAATLMEFEHVPMPDADAEWAEIELAAGTPVRRPSPPSPAAPAPAPLRLLDAPGLIGPVSVHAPEGEIVVTFAGAELRPGLTRRVAQTDAGTESVGASRAEDIARRAAQRRPEEPAGAAPARPPRPERNGFGARAASGRVRFCQPSALGKRVEVAGDFSGWRPVPLRLDPDGAAHELCVELKPGRHEYRLIVDGHSIADPYNTDWVLNQFGQPHSVVEVPQEQEESPECELGCGAD